jgi:hypothetical protein
VRVLPLHGGLPSAVQVRGAACWHSVVHGHLLITPSTSLDYTPAPSHASPPLPFTPEFGTHFVDRGDFVDNSYAVCVGSYWVDQCLHCVLRCPFVVWRLHKHGYLHACKAAMARPAMFPGAR